MVDSDDRRRRATSGDVARASGVSRATVSYVLNDTPNRRISEATRLLVLDTARRLGHMPNPQARALKLGDSNIVLCLVPDLPLGIVFERTLDLLTRDLSAHGLALMIHRSGSGPSADDISQLWRYLTPSLVLSLCGTSPSVATDLRDRLGVGVVTDRGLIEHTRIGALQAKHLIGRGTRRLGFVAPAADALSAAAEERLAGVKEACRFAGLDDPEVVAVDDSMTTHATAIARLLELRVDGVCAHNDDVALMLLAAMRAAGVMAPADLAVIGADDVPMAQYGLTTISLNPQDCAASIGHRVLAALGHDSGPPPPSDALRLVGRSSA